MALSGSTDYVLNGNQLIKLALQQINVVGIEDDPTSTELTHGRQVLNNLLKSWQAQGIHVFTMTEGQITLTQGQESYVFGSGGDTTAHALRVHSIRMDQSGSGVNEFPMTRLSRQEYFDMPAKTSEGTPSNWYYNPGRNSGTLFLWPSPASSSSIIRYTYEALIDDVDASTNDVEFPQEWMKAITTGLAADLAPHYGRTIEEQANHANRASAELERMKDWDVEGPSSIYITPDEDPYC